MDQPMPPAPAATADYEADRHHHADFWARCDRLLQRLPKKAQRSAAEQAAAEAILALTRAAREQFLGRHAERLYDVLTDGCTRFVRLEALVLAAAAAVPGLVPSRERLAAEAALDQRDKDGVEIDQGILLSHLLAGARSGMHLCHAMLLPLPGSA